MFIWLIAPNLELFSIIIIGMFELLMAVLPHGISFSNLELGLISMQEILQVHKITLETKYLELLVLFILNLFKALHISSIQIFFIRSLSNIHA